MNRRRKGRITNFNRGVEDGILFSDETDYINVKNEEAEQTVQFADTEELEFVANPNRAFQIGRIMIYVGETRDYGVARIYVNESL